MKPLSLLATAVAGVLFVGGSAASAATITAADFTNGSSASAGTDPAFTAQVTSSVGGEPTPDLFNVYNNPNASGGKLLGITSGTPGELGGEVDRVGGVESFRIDFLSPQVITQLVLADLDRVFNGGVEQARLVVSYADSSTSNFFLTATGNLSVYSDELSNYDESTAVEITTVSRPLADGGLFGGAITSIAFNGANITGGGQADSDFAFVSLTAIPSPSAVLAGGPLLALVGLRRRRGA